MITLFRRVREKLIGEGQVRRYLLYAFGEIFLVVFGILIALQLDNWYSDIKEQRIAKEYVERLITDLKSDTLEFSTYSERSFRHNEISKDVYSLYKGESDNFQNKTEALISIQMIGRSWIPSVQTNTYQDLISTGNIRLIGNKNISDEIIQYYNNTYEDWFVEYKKRLWNGYLPLAIDLLDLGFLEDILDSEFEDPDISMPHQFELSVPDSQADAIITEMQSRPEFDFHIRNIARTHRLNAHILSNIRDAASDLLNDLESYHKQKFGGY